MLGAGVQRARTARAAGPLLLHPAPSFPERAGNRHLLLRRGGEWGRPPTGAPQTAGLAQGHGLFDG